MGNYHYIAKVGEELHFSAGFFQEKDGWGGGGGRHKTTLQRLIFFNRMKINVLY